MSFIYESNLVNFPVVAGGAALLFTAGIAAPAILPALGLLGIGKGYCYVKSWHRLS